MAISFVGSSAAWGTSTIGGAAASLTGSEAAGDRMFVFAGWKDFSITNDVANNIGEPTTFWTEITEFADGSVGQGNGTGSMKVAAYWRDWQSGDDSPSTAESSTPNIIGAVMLTLRKDAGDTWDTPLFATAAWPLGGSGGQTVSASSTIAVPDNSIVMAAIIIRDDSATFTRGATTGIDVASGITWNGNYVEAPATHLSTTLGNDMSGDTGYRLVTTGGTVTLRVTATLSANETGSVLWVVQGLTAAATFSPPFRHNTRCIRVR